MRDRPEPRCADQWGLFESADPRCHELAKKECLGSDTASPCPLFDTCQATVADILAGPWRSGLHGTWAGKFYKLKSGAA